MAPYPPIYDCTYMCTCTYVYVRYGFSKQLQVYQFQYNMDSPAVLESHSLTAESAPLEATLSQTKTKTQRQFNFVNNPCLHGRADVNSQVHMYDICYTCVGLEQNSVCVCVCAYVKAHSCWPW